MIQPLVVVVVVVLLVVGAVLLRQYDRNHRRRQVRLEGAVNELRATLRRLEKNCGYSNLQVAKRLLDEVGRRPTSDDRHYLISQDELDHLNRVIGKGLHVAAELETQAWTHRCPTMPLPKQRRETTHETP